MDKKLMNDSLAKTLNAMAQRIITIGAGGNLTEQAVRDIITTLLASDAQAVDAANGVSLMTPKAVDKASRAIWAEMVGAAPETLDTIAELAAAFQNNPDIIAALQEMIDDLQSNVNQLWDERTLHGAGADTNVDASQISWGKSGYFKHKAAGTYRCSGMPADLNVAALADIDQDRVAHIVATSAKWDGADRFSVSFILQQGVNLWTSSLDTDVPVDLVWTKVGAGGGSGGSGTGVTLIDFNTSPWQGYKNYVSPEDMRTVPEGTYFGFDYTNNPLSGGFESGTDGYQNSAVTVVVSNPVVPNGPPNLCVWEWTLERNGNTFRRTYRSDALTHPAEQPWDLVVHQSHQLNDAVALAVQNFQSATQNNGGEPPMRYATNVTKSVTIAAGSGLEVTMSVNMMHDSSALWNLQTYIDGEIVEYDYGLWAPPTVPDCRPPTDWKISSRKVGGDAAASQWQQSGAAGTFVWCPHSLSVSATEAAPSCTGTFEIGVKMPDGTEVIKTVTLTLNLIVA